MSQSLSYRILLYYQYTPIEDPAEFAREHLAFCQELGLRGRILVAAEGINGTVSGTVEQTDSYMAAMHCDPRFAGMPFKVDEAEGHAFRRISVKARREIVALGQESLDPRTRTARRLKPREFRQALERDDVVVVDVRNSYEYDLGHFRGAVRPPVKTFKEFPQWVRETLTACRDKTILTYCTGGIRCEKFSALLLEEGFKDVYQLEGGIVTYGKDPEVKGELFEGRCYVFDERGSVEVNRTGTSSVVGRCRHCAQACERFVNCANLDCDTQYICCVSCEFENRRSCSEECRHAPNHEFNPATAGTKKSFYR